MSPLMDFSLLEQVITEIDLRKKVYLSEKQDEERVEGTLQGSYSTNILWPLIAKC